MLTLFGRRLFALPRSLDRIVQHIDVEGTSATPVRIPESASVEPDRSRTPDLGHAAVEPGQERSARTSESPPPDP